MGQDKSQHQQKAYSWTSIGSENSVLESSNFYGKMTLQYEEGRIILLRFEQTKKP